GFSHSLNTFYKDIFHVLSPFFKNRPSNAILHGRLCRRVISSSNSWVYIEKFTQYIHIFLSNHTTFMSLWAYTKKYVSTTLVFSKTRVVGVFFSTIAQIMLFMSIISHFLGHSGLIFSPSPKNKPKAAKTGPKYTAMHIFQRIALQFSLADD
ncbi:MAG: hypothetical protein IJ419_05065, partial [Agathobacter sp.]|nr:hypothetical protein [Agathobacter sp.]